MITTSKLFCYNSYLLLNITKIESKRNVPYWVWFEIVHKIWYIIYAILVTEFPHNFVLEHPSFYSNFNTLKHAIVYVKDIVMCCCDWLDWIGLDEIREEKSIPTWVYFCQRVGSLSFSFACRSRVLRAPTAKEPMGFVRW